MLTLTKGNIMKATLKQIQARQDNICLRCGEITEEAGTSNQIDGCCYKGRGAWIICPKCYAQNEQGDWYLDCGC